MRVLRWLVVLGLIGGATGLWLTRAVPLPDDALAGVSGDASRGAVVFAAAGCSACHTAPVPEAAAEPADAPGTAAEIAAGDLPVLSGGKRFVSDFGTFIAPNISPDIEEGIGGWTDLQIATAMQRGVSPDGTHYFPAFPYVAYANATPQDVADLIAHLRTLPASDAPSLPHEVGFPFNIRRAVGGWKLLYMRIGWTLADAPTEQLVRGRYLVEALGHCGECHTPRGLLGGLDRSRWLGGAAHPSGDGRIPNITSGGLTWSEADIAEYLRSGFTPDFDSAGAEMAEVVRNIAQLSDDDRLAIAAYLKAVPAVAPLPVDG